jgi:hypothetical protein
VQRCGTNASTSEHSPIRLLVAPNLDQPDSYGSEQCKAPVFVPSQLSIDIQDIDFEPAFTIFSSGGSPTPWIPDMRVLIFESIQSSTQRPRLYNNGHRVQVTRHFCGDASALIRCARPAVVWQMQFSVLNVVATKEPNRLHRCRHTSNRRGGFPSR